MKICIHCLTIVVLMCTVSAQAQSGILADNNTIIVNFPTNTPQNVINTLRLTYKATVVDSLVNIPKTYRWRVSFPNTVAGVVLSNISSLEGHIKGQSDISGGSANYITYSDKGSVGEAAVRTLPLLTATNASGQAYNTSLYLGNTCKNCLTKEPQTIVKIAQFDSGFDPTATSSTLNPFLQTYLGTAFNFSNTTTSVDNNGHGTFVFGIMAQLASYWGLNNLKIHPYKTQDASGKGSIWGLCKAFDKAIAERINIVNLSVNFKEKWTTNPEKNTMYCIIKYVGANHKILVINSAGNDTLNLNLAKTIGSESLRVSPSSYPNCPNLIVVSAINQGKQLATFSDWQPYSSNSLPNKTLFGMPGVGIRSIYLGGSLRESSGTSFAAPIITAYAALIAALRPTSVCEYAPIKNSLVSTAELVVSTTNAPQSQYVPNICSAVADYRKNIGSICVPVSKFSVAPTTLNNQATTTTTKAMSISMIGLNVFPNPCGKSVQLEIEAAEENTTQVTIFSLAGQAVLHQKQLFTQGVNRLSFDVASLPNGIYNCVVRLEGRTISQKFVKE